MTWKPSLYSSLLIILRIIINIKTTLWRNIFLLVLWLVVLVRWFYVEFEAEDQVEDQTH